MPTILGLSILVLNPISPLNWITALILYFSMVRKKKKDDKLIYLKALGIYLAVLIPIYLLMCIITQMIPSMTPPFIFLGLLCNAGK